MLAGKREGDHRKYVPSTIWLREEVDSDDQDSQYDRLVTFNTAISQAVSYVMDLSEGSKNAPAAN